MLQCLYCDGAITNKAAVDIYYEIYKGVTIFGSDHKFWVKYDVDRTDIYSGHYIPAEMHSIRIWTEDETGIKFLKNQKGDVLNTKDFMLIKLKSIELPRGGSQ